MGLRGWNWLARVTLCVGVFAWVMFLVLALDDRRWAAGCLIVVALMAVTGLLACRAERRDRFPHRG
jgi:hypothetical protein